MKTRKELNEPKERAAALNAELRQLTNDELEQAAGGVYVKKPEPPAPHPREY